MILKYTNDYSWIDEAVKIFKFKHNTDLTDFEIAWIYAHTINEMNYIKKFKDE